MTAAIPERHSVNCYFCGQEADERECVPNQEEWGGTGDGGDICPKCQQERVRARWAEFFGDHVTVTVIRD